MQTTRRVRLSLHAHPCVYQHVPFFLLINTSLVSLLSVSVWKFISAQLTGQGPGHWPVVPGGLVVWIQCSHRPGLTSVSSREPKPCFEPLQGEATGDRPRPHLPGTRPRAVSFLPHPPCRLKPVLWPISSFPSLNRPPVLCPWHFFF